MQAQTRIANRYRLTYPIGRGAMGEVWAASDETLDRPVAIKFLRQEAIADHDRSTAVERFMREARATARLNHVGVPTVHDVGFHDGNIYLVMQLVPGVVLGDLIAERGQLSVTWVAAIGAQICSVLSAAHSASLVHRDLKPQNLMITPGGTVMVLDFGVAALLDPVDLPRLTLTGEMLGTPIYIAPEQADGGVVGPQADLYALGCVLHEVLTGAPPYQADTALDLVRSHLQAPVPLVSEHRHDVPDGVVRLVKQLLAKDPRQRPGSAAEVYDLLIPWMIGDVGLMRQPSRSERGAEVGDPTMPYRIPFGRPSR